MSQTENMHRVAHHLQVTAVGAAAADRDAFARSAYNRYYYSVFLQARTMMRQMDPKWSKLPHASYPDVLRGQITKAFKAERKKADRNGDMALAHSIDQACRAIAALREIIVKANTTRVVADYEPEEGIDFTAAERFSLRSVDVTEAHAWNSRAGSLCQTILRSWKQFNV
jgi:hypothetical protein